MKPQTITAFAKAFGLSRATLLYYDRIGLLRPAEVSAAGYRLYGEAEHARMTRIETFRKAGLPLKAIQAVLDGARGGNVEAALEQRLVALNAEMAQLQAQQRLVTRLLGRSGPRKVDVAQWVKMLEEAGVDAAGRRRWHRAFERDAPQAHHEFLVSLGLSPDEIEAVRKRAQ
ncbi:MAG: MerR family transcriptional regulator [Nevskiales bacterium]|nr:MerR family transcriptional regulator [Nevskiales bacterium]